MSQSLHDAERPEPSRGAHVQALLLVITVAAVAGMLAARNLHAGAWVMPLILLASTGFVALAAARGAFRGGYDRCMLLGLAGCWCGDMFGPQNFLAGLGAFLLAHLGFVAAFCCNGIVWRRTLWALPVLAVTDAALLAWLMPHVPAGEVGPVTSYVAVISLMVVFACGASHNAQGRRALLGAVAFFISDVFVARWRYVDPSPINGNLCYPIYYTACIVMAMSVPFLPRGTR